MYYTQCGGIIPESEYITIVSADAQNMWLSNIT